jgi:hypothetical protein
MKGDGSIYKRGDVYWVSYSPGDGRPRVQRSAETDDPKVARRPCSGSCARADACSMLPRRQSAAELRFTSFSLRTGAGSRAKVECFPLLSILPTEGSIFSVF